MDFSIICRLCLDIPKIASSIFEENIPFLIEEITSLKVSESDQLPPNVCHSCLDNLKVANKIKKQILISDEVLKLFLNSKGNNRLKKKVNINEKLPPDLELEVNNITTPGSKREYKTSSQDDTPSLCDISEVKEARDKNPEIEGAQIDNPGLRETETEETEPTIKTRTLPFTRKRHPNRYETEFTILIKDEDIIEKTSQNGSPIYYCKICERTVQPNGQLDFAYKHKIQHKKALCKICGVVVKYAHMRTHVLGVHRGEPHICDVCGKTCKSSINLWYHSHKKKPMHKCETCSKEYRTSSSLSTHKRKHTGYKPYQCHHCSTCFTTNSILQRHINLVHLRKRDHQCEFCMKKFSTEYALKTHRRQHTGETPFLCSYCPDSFRQMVSLKTHLKSKHGSHGTDNSIKELG